MPSEATTLWPRVIGQMRVKRTLLSALRSSRLAHAYLFSGAEGVGKDAMALELARVLHCERSTEEACGTCASCLKALHLQHPDIQLVTALPVGKGEDKNDGPLSRLSPTEVSSIQAEYRKKGEDPYHRISIGRANVIKINSIREIRREATMTTFGGRKRFFVISGAEDMEESAANALLKTLEEPAGDCVIILTTAHREALLPTILSRCQQIRFDPLSEGEIHAALLEREGVEPARAALLARIANGSYSHARELLQADVFDERQFVVSFIRDALSGNASGVAEAAERVAGWKNRDQVERFLLFVLLWFRDAMVLARGGAVINLDQEEDLKRFVAKNPQADLPRAIQETERALSLLGRNTYIKLIIFTLATRLRATLPRGR
jgi:DNA polymerase-3 subunit delta'